MARAPCVRIRKWDDYQHYPNGARQMIWAKLYSKRLQDYELMSLRADVRELSTCLICIAVETENTIPLDYKWLATRVQMNAAKVEFGMQELLTVRFVEPISRKHLASKPLANRYQDASPRARRAETETEKRKAKSRTTTRPERAKPANRNASRLASIDPLHADRLLQVLDDKDSGTEHQIRSFVGKLPPAAFEKVREQVVEGLARHPSAYAHAELRRMTESGEYAAA